MGVVHVPKTGGMALRLALLEIPGSYGGPLYSDVEFFGDKIYLENTPSPKLETVASVADLGLVVSNHSLVVGHYAASSLLEAGCTTIAVQVREPRSRVLSLYRYWRSLPDSEITGWGLWGEHVARQAQLLPLKGFLQAPQVWPAVDNLIARQVFGFRRTRLGILGGSRSPSRSYARLADRLSVVEWSSRSDTFVERICEYMGESTVPALRRENATETVGEEQRLDPETVRLLERFTFVDRLFLERLTEHGLLSRRTPEELDEDFRATAARLNFC
jgi:hypothetical protein